MLQRVQLEAPQARKKLYTSTNDDALEFISSGSHLLDKVLGGGWCVGRVANVVGDRSSGKTGLAIEACANFARVGKAEQIRYAESESALVEMYAKNIGMPKGMQRTEPNMLKTVEDFAADCLRFLAGLDGRSPALYVLDSLDALSDEAEQKRNLGAATYGTARAKLLSEFFRKHISDLAHKRCTLLVISQVRDNIGVMFGERSKRAGGRALDFYASQILWLYEMGRIERTVLSAKRAVGIEVRARAKKLKVGTPFREAELSMLFDYGIDDEVSMLDWLHTNKALGLVEYQGDPVKGLMAMRKQQDRVGIAQMNKLLCHAVNQHWERIEQMLRPPMRKYQ